MVDDVVQDTLLTVHHVHHSYAPGRPVRPWLAAIVQRRTADARRRHGRIATRELAGHPGPWTAANPDPVGPASLEHREVVARLTRPLSSGQREAIELVKLRGLSLREASAQSGQSVALLKVNVHRAIRRMRQAWESLRARDPAACLP